MIARSTALLETDASSACAAAAFSNNFQKFFSRALDRFLGATVREHLTFAADFKLDGAPFLGQASRTGSVSMPNRGRAGRWSVVVVCSAAFGRPSVDHSGGF